MAVLLLVHQPDLADGRLDRQQRPERAVRDLYTATQHFMVSSSAYETHGQDLLGVTRLDPLS